ncbi:DUF6325 family protein [Glycomyces buryatensis]|uniref:DUF1269 domain-containing protein n=1 Tax=Glycomyces buryatensis TaxID=2570927 RepID=A0A4S8QII2_9ACTN|nr:DUF6325 family protein [Glycomyces buryatensis]THV42805.1 hypothetical protein FAB82_04625 [Glycomyces buryatensis]
MNIRAPVDMVLVEFPGNQFRGEILAELERLVDDGTIRVLDALLVRKDPDGTVTWLEAEDADDDRLARLVGDSIDLLAEEDAEAIADELEPNSSVGMLVFEHAWAGKLAGAIRGTEGRVLDWARVPPAAIDQLATTSN